MPLGNAYVKLGEIIAAAAQELRDDDFGRLGRPFYVSAAQRGVSDMNYATNFFKKMFVADIPEDNIIELPNDLTEKDQAYVAQADNCNVTSSSILWIKPNMISFGGTGYIAQNKGRNHDVLQWSLQPGENPPNHLYFAGERSGKLYLSPSCRARFNKVFIPYTGIGVDCFGEEFDVPMWAREAITDYVILRAARALQREDPQFLRTVVGDKQWEMTNSQGSWMTAIWRYKRSDKKTLYDTAGYTFDFGATP